MAQQIITSFRIFTHTEIGHLIRLRRLGECYTTIRYYTLTILLSLIGRGHLHKFRRNTFHSKLQRIPMNFFLFSFHFNIYLRSALQTWMRAIMPFAVCNRWTVRRKCTADHFVLIFVRRGWNNRSVFLTQHAWI